LKNISFGKHDILFKGYPKMTTSGNIDMDE